MNSSLEHIHTNSSAERVCAKIGFEFDNMDSESMSVLTPPEFRAAAEIVRWCIFPKKSAPRYNRQLADFTQWCLENKIEHISDNVIVAYYQGLIKRKIL
jgi:hypothetical protein